MTLTLHTTTTTYSGKTGEVRSDHHKVIFNLVRRYILHVVLQPTHFTKSVIKFKTVITGKYHISFI